MMIDKFEIKKEGEKLFVYVELPHAEPLRKVRRFTLGTKQVLKLLEEKGIKHGRCLRKNSLSNWREHLRKGEWIFEIFVDKPAEPVILEEEKSVRPKPKRTRRTRSSIKKVSTEE